MAFDNAYSAAFNRVVIHREKIAAEIKELERKIQDKQNYITGLDAAIAIMRQGNSTSQPLPDTKHDRPVLPEPSQQSADDAAPASDILESDPVYRGHADNRTNPG